MKTYESEDIKLVSAQIYWDVSTWKKDKSRSVFYDKYKKYFITCPYDGGEHHRMIDRARNFKYISHYNERCEPEWIAEDITESLKEELPQGSRSSWPTNMMSKDDESS